MRQAAGFLILALVLCGTLHADPVPVRHVQGTAHGFLRVTTPEGKQIATGDLVQTVRNGRVTARLVFKFRDGSVDDETTVFTQQGVFHLVSDHHIQKGPYFPTQMDQTVLGSGKVVLRSVDKIGKETLVQDQMALPSDLANGLSLTLVGSLSESAPETRVSMLLGSGKPRLVKVIYRPDGTDQFTVGGASRTANRFVARIELGGITGVVAPIVGKQPKDYHLWFLGGPAPVFLRADGQLYEQGPIVQIQQVSATFPASVVDEKK